MLESWDEDDHLLYRCTCDGCGEQGEPRPAAHHAVEVSEFHEFGSRIHLCETCYDQRGRPWVLWYDVSEVAERRQALDDLISLRADPHVDRVLSRDLIRAIETWGRNPTGSRRRLCSVGIIIFGAGYDEPADPALRDLQDRRARPRLDRMTASVRSHPETSYGDLRADLDHIRNTIAGALQVELPPDPPPEQVMPGGLLDPTRERATELPEEEMRQRIISEAIRSWSGRRRLTQSILGPLRQRRDYQSIARRTFFVEQLPEGALPVYDRPEGMHFEFQSEWPDWVAVDMTVYNREQGYQAYLITEVSKNTVKFSEVNSPDEVLRLHIITARAAADDLDKTWATVLPPTAWERLMRD